MTFAKILTAARNALATASFLLIPSASTALPIDEVLNLSEFGIFSKALKQAGLWDRVASEDGVTVFAISDTSMKNEGSAFLLGKVLLTRHNEQRLRDLMAYHVSFGPALDPDDIRGEVIVTTSAEACLAIYKFGTGLHVGPEAVVTDVKPVDNGIVYVIDRLLWQPWQDETRCGGVVSKLQ